jgi:hypothetical protein
MAVRRPTSTQPNDCQSSLPRERWAATSLLGMMLLNANATSPMPTILLLTSHSSGFTGSTLPEHFGAVREPVYRIFFIRLAIFYSACSVESLNICGG